MTKRENGLLLVAPTMAQLQYGRLSKFNARDRLTPSDRQPSRSMRTLARWVLFISPLQRVLHLRHDKGGPLKGCLLCISGDGTIAVIALDDYQL